MLYFSWVFSFMIISSFFSVNLLDSGQILFFFKIFFLSCSCSQTTSSLSYMSHLSNFAKSSKYLNLCITCTDIISQNIYDIHLCSFQYSFQNETSSCIKQNFYSFIRSFFFLSLAYQLCISDTQCTMYRILQYLLQIKPGFDVVKFFFFLGRVESTQY